MAEVTDTKQTFPHGGKKFQPGQSGNPNGRPKGRRSLSTIIRDILEDEINWDLLPADQAQQLSERFKTKKGWEALVYVAVEKALQGDSQAREWLRKAGYGDKLDLTSDEKPLPILGVLGVQENDRPAENSQPEQTDTSSPGGDGGGKDRGDNPLPDK